MRSSTHPTTLFALLTLLAFSALQLVAGAAAPAPASSKADLVARRLASRQMTRQKLINRSTIKRSLKPRQSSVPRTYPNCAAGSVAGYARFDRYDYLGADISGGAVAAENEATCLELCQATAGCQGIFWYQGTALPCFRKISNNVNTNLQINQPSDRAGAGADLKGSCQSLESNFDSTKMASCCNTVDAYPTCSVASKAGYARFGQWDYTGADMPPNNPAYNVAGERACLVLCESVSGCVGVFYWPDNNGAGPNGRCYLKNQQYLNNNFLATTEAARTPNSESSLRGTCSKQAANGISANKMAACCNTIG